MREPRRRRRAGPRRRSRASRRARRGQSSASASRKTTSCVAARLVERVLHDGASEPAAAVRAERFDILDLCGRRRCAPRSTRRSRPSTIAAKKRVGTAAATIGRFASFSCCAISSSPHGSRRIVVPFGAGSSSVERHLAPWPRCRRAGRARARAPSRGASSARSRSAASSRRSPACAARSSDHAAVVAALHRRVRLRRELVGRRPARSTRQVVRVVDVRDRVARRGRRRVQSGTRRSAARLPAAGGGTRGCGRCSPPYLGWLELGEPPFEEAPLGVGVRELERAVVGDPRLVAPIEAAQQLGAGRVQVVVAVELEPVDDREAGARARRPRRPRRRGSARRPASRCSAGELAVEGGDLAASRAARRCGAPRSPPAATYGPRPCERERALEQRPALVDLRAASQSVRSWSSSSTSSPSRSARRAPRVVQEHQREQPVRLRLVRHQLGERAAEPDRLGGEVAAAAVALVEDEVDDRQHGGEPLGQQVGAAARGTGCRPP